jgi:hypothetical protein
MKYFVDVLIRWCERNGRTQHITGSVKTDIYMCRYILFRSSLFSIYLHQFLRSDKDSYHDHPWNFWTYVVSGGYQENRPEGSSRDISNQRGEENDFSGCTKIKFYSTNNLLRNTKNYRLQYRKAEDLHWVQLNRSYTFEERFSAPTTVCLIGRRRRSWGFIDTKTNEWSFWKKFLGIPYTNEDMNPSSESKV